MVSRASEPPGENLQECEGDVEEEAASKTISSSSSDKAFMPPPLSLADDFCLFQDLTKRVPDSLQILLEQVKDTLHNLLDILHSSSSSKVALPINETLLDPVKTVWQTPASVALTCKRADKKYYVPARVTEFLFSHLSPNSIVVGALNSHDR